MDIGLVDVDGHNFPSLPLMKLSAWHKKQGDNVEWAVPFLHYDKVYVSRVFGNEYTQTDDIPWNADEVIYGGTGYAIKVENGKEVYRKEIDKDLPYEVEHIYPDYDLYPELTADRAYGFLTRGCPNNCSFCIVSQKEGRVSRKVADLTEWWGGQKHIELMDANILACKDRMELLEQLADSKAEVNFAQGIDARFVNAEVAKMFTHIKTELWHFAFDFMKNEKAIVNGLRVFKEITKCNKSKSIVYMLTNYDTTFQEDWYRVRTIRDLGYMPDVRIYRKSVAPKFLTDLQRWANNRFLFKSCDFPDYEARGKTMRGWYPEVFKEG